MKMLLLLRRKQEWPDLDTTTKCHESHCRRHIGDVWVPQPMARNKLTYQSYR
ncbi:hypothetical protein L798_13199 [Zootermopsis nevadensis]|uniref:Uncharacterized protein n=1 Tax=Zootermopsis nevadensis TaxID=136037 RepID=A0A067QSY0_ZOONE|nr:hypothetical protein L798_13199 [Zootermopsis nevadensis]